MLPPLLSVTDPCQSAHFSTFKECLQKVETGFRHTHMVSLLINLFVTVSGQPCKIVNCPPGFSFVSNPVCEDLEAQSQWGNVQFESLKTGSLFLCRWCDYFLFIWSAGTGLAPVGLRSCQGVEISWGVDHEGWKGGQRDGQVDWFGVSSCAAVVPVPLWWRVVWSYGYLPWGVASLQSLIVI